MNELELWLIIIAFSGFFVSRWMMRLAPALSELPLKTILATFAAALLGASGFYANLSSSVLWVAAIICPLFIFGPIVLTSLVRAKQYSVARLITSFLYWSDGHLRMRRLLAQAALQQGDSDAVLQLISTEEADHLLLAQLFAFEGQWDKVLALKMPEEGDNAFLGLAARVEAYIGLGRLDLAAQALEDMRERWEASEKGPIAYRSLNITEAKLAAEKGQLDRVRTTLQTPPEGVAAYTLYEIAARSAEQSGQSEQAARLYAQAYATAPESLHERYAKKLEDYGQPLPVITKKRIMPLGTVGLMAALVLAYLVQVWLERSIHPNAPIVIAGFLDRVMGIPDSEGLWRYLSYAFVHGGILHIAMNTYVLFDIGRIYEARRGWANMLAAFVIGSIMGAYFSVLATPGGIPLVGASGGVLGIAGALLADVFRRQTQQDRVLLRSLLQWMAFIVIFSVAIPNVSLWGHVGGVIGGMLWGFVRQGLPKLKQLDYAFGGLSIGLIIYVLYAAFTWAVQHQAYLTQ